MISVARCIACRRHGVIPLSGCQLRSSETERKLTLTRLYAVFLSGVRAYQLYEEDGLTPPTLMRMMAMKVKNVGMRVSQDTRRYFAESISVILGVVLS